MRGVAVQRYTDEEMLAALRAAAGDRDEPLTTTAYDAHHAAHGGAGRLTIIKRFGTWRAALGAAGVRANEASGHTAHWTEATMVEWVAEYLAEPGTTGSYAGYAEWAKARAGAPSGATIRNRFGGWAAARKAATPGR